MKTERLLIGAALLWGATCLFSPVRAEESGEQEKDKEQQMMRSIMEKLQPQIEAEVQKRVKEELSRVEATRTTAPPAPSSTVVSKERVDELEKQVADLSEATKKSFPSQFNPAIGLVGETVASFDSRKNSQTGSSRPGGFDINQRSTELNLSASVDPFARGYAVINASANPITGEATAAVEEAAVITTSLPYNLTAEGGRFFGEFGRLAFVHDHELPFVNRPLALDSYIGGESKTDGLQLNYLLPIDHYVSWTIGTGDQFGGTLNNPGGYRSLKDLNYWSHLSTYFTLTPDVSLETGVSGLWNPRTEGRGGVVTLSNNSTRAETQRQLYGLELTLRYEPLQNNQFQGLVWGTEAFVSHNRFLFDPNGTPGTGDEYHAFESSRGFYSYIAAKLSRQWTAGFLLDYLQNPQWHHDDTFAYSPFLTWNTSHFQTIRLQYTHTDRSKESGLKDDDAVYLQWVWIIGSHSHGFSQR